MLELADPDVLMLLGATGAAPDAAATAKPAAARAASRSLDHAVSIATDRAAFDALGAEWVELEASAAGATLFQSFAWCRAVFDHHQRHSHEFRPLVLTLRHAGRLLALLPLQMKVSGLSATLTGFGEPYQQYTDVLLAPDAPRTAAARLLDAACRVRGVSGIDLLKVRDDSALAPLLAARRAMRTNADAAPFVDLRPYPDFKAYLSTRNAKTRKNMRNTKNRLARGGTLDHRIMSEPAEISELITRTHSGRERWLAAQGLTSRAFRDQSFGEFAAAVGGGKGGLSVMAMSLTLDGRPIADQWGFVHNGRYYAYAATWAAEHEEASPGKLHLEQVIRSCHERGIAVADFLMPAVPYKFTWTDDAVAVADYALPLSLGARLRFSLWSARVRPFLKRTAMKLPAGTRRRLAKVLLRR